MLTLTANGPGSREIASKINFSEKGVNYHLNHLREWLGTSQRTGMTLRSVAPSYTLDRLDADVEFNSFAPYLGIGWASGTPGTAGFIFSADLGVLYQGSGGAA